MPARKRPARANLEPFLKRNRGNPGTAVHELWAMRDNPDWGGTGSFYTRLGQEAADLGQTLLAYDILKEGFERFPDDARVGQLYGLALLRCGFAQKARDVLEDIVRKGCRDEESLGILGSVYKSLWLSGDTRDRACLRRARDHYLEAFRLSGGYYSGINAASLSFLLGRKKEGRDMAAEVRGKCLREANSRRMKDYWREATLGEASLLLGNGQEAALHYGIAREAAGREYARVASTRRQLLLLSRCVPVEESLLSIMSIPPVLVCVGHMIDRQDRAHPRFPASSAPAVKRGIRAVLDSLDAGIGYSSSACGADILFLECMQSRGAETAAVLPFDRGDFFGTSVSYAGPQWTRRAERALSRCSRVEEASRGEYGGEDILFSYANRVILGKAILRSELLETQAHLLAVWDGKTDGKTGGTARTVETWMSLKLPLTVIDPLSGRVRDSAPTPGIGAVASSFPAVSRISGGNRAPSGRRVVSILFADMVGYSRLEEEQIPAYVGNFLGTIARKLGSLSGDALFLNTWGDAVFMVFDKPISAAEYAMALRDLVLDTDWMSLGLPESLNIRIGLHAGPVYCMEEPLLKRPSFFGSHINHAARIEPITSPGNVYVSEPFAALLASDIRNAYRCSYVGEIVLPKKFGSYPTYHLIRKTMNEQRGGSR